MIKLTECLFELLQPVHYGKEELMFSFMDLIPIIKKITKRSFSGVWERNTKEIAKTPENFRQFITFPCFPNASASFSVFPISFAKFRKFERKFIKREEANGILSQKQIKKQQHTMEKNCPICNTNIDALTFNRHIPKCYHQSCVANEEIPLCT